MGGPGPGRPTRSVAPSDASQAVQTRRTSIGWSQPRWTSWTGGPASGAAWRSPQCISATSTGDRSRPAGVSRYSDRGGRSWYRTFSRTPCSTRRASRSARRLRAIPRSRWSASKRRIPRNASRRMSRVHRSPITSSVDAIEQVSTSPVTAWADSAALASPVVTALIGADPIDVPGADPSDRRPPDMRTTVAGRSVLIRNGPCGVPPVSVRFLGRSQVPGPIGGTPDHLPR